MGKAKKIKVSKNETKRPKIALADQIEQAGAVKMKNRNKKRFRRDEDEEFVDPKLAKKILHQAQRQQREIAEEAGEIPRPRVPKKPITKLGNDLSDDEVSSEEEEFDGSEYYQDIQLDEEDERAIQMFMDRDGKPLPTLANVIMDKLRDKKAELESELSDGCSDIDMEEIDPRVQAMYEGVRDVLSKYRSGKLPKAFKIIPTLRNWEQILHITDPNKWTAAAMYQATRIFASNLKENMVERFYSLVLLPRIRDDIVEYKRLNFHLYQALRKALFKPGGFMKGFLLPLLESGTCTLREAVIIGSVLAKNSIPVLHSAAAMLKIAEMDYTGANSIILRILFDKKYALPYKVVDGVVFHFLRFERDQRDMPVLWHQALLTFVQRYKSELCSEHRDALLLLIKKKSHALLSPEIRRELQHAQCRDVAMTEPTQEPMIE
ncbi:hypothetical protein QAD02_000558 [Eretmocerus hayati]|uniref:Uncharacterized protein n=1 Tax=Eretmocerus hayati TaxID=131215 RepID=A0ACC2NE04_9HYME|nr:hypothetical protein QAD02_000558 [Eretmocerus hayati]